MRWLIFTDGFVAMLHSKQRACVTGAQTTEHISGQGNRTFRLPWPVHFTVQGFCLHDKCDVCSRDRRQNVLRCVCSAYELKKELTT